jgi:hypothetical protein
MEMVLGSETLGRCTVETVVAGAAIAEQRPVRPADCPKMARMTLAELLYYVLVGDGRTARFSAA